MFRLILTLIILLSGFLSAQQTLSTYFEVDQEAVNRILLEEYNASAVHFSGTEQGYNWDLQLQVPEVRFTPGFMHLNATLTAVTDVGNFEWTISPAIAVDYDVSLDDLRAVITTFDTWVNSNLTGVPAWLRNIVINSYEELELTLYPSKILDYATSYVPAYIDVEVTDIDDFSIESQDEKLVVEIRIKIEGHPISVSVEQSGSSYTIFSNVETTIKKLYWFNTVPQETSKSVNLLIPKNGSATYNNAPISNAILFKIFLESPTNQYIRWFRKEGGVWKKDKAIN